MKKLVLVCLSRIVLLHFGEGNKMSRRYEEDEAPILGNIKGGYVLVCHGDDSPTEWINWLEPIIKESVELINLAEEYEIPIKLSRKTNQITGVFDLLHLIGVSIDSEPWTGSLISGIYRFGWIKKGEIRQAKSNAKKLLKQLEIFIIPKIRQAIISKFEEIKSFDDFLERTSPDPKQLIRTIDSQKIKLAELQKKLAILEDDAKSKEQDSLLLFSIKLLELASSMASPTPIRFIVGPFALWDDGILYVLKSIGKSKLPAEPQINSILKIATDSKRQIVEVHEETLVGRWLSGPVYRSLGNDLNQWVEAWQCEKKFTRKFQTQDKKYIETLSEIANSL